MIFSTPIISPTIHADSFEISLAFRNLVMKDQFSRTYNEDAASHLHNFIEVWSIKSPIRSNLSTSKKI